MNNGRKILFYLIFFFVAFGLGMLFEAIHGSTAYRDGFSDGIGYSAQFMKNHKPYIQNAILANELEMSTDSAFKTADVAVGGQK